MELVISVVFAEEVMKIDVYMAFMSDRVIMQLPSQALIGPRSLHISYWHH